MHQFRNSCLFTSSFNYFCFLFASFWWLWLTALPEHSLPSSVFRCTRVHVVVVVVVVINKFVEFDSLCSRAEKPFLSGNLSNRQIIASQMSFYPSCTSCIQQFCHRKKKKSYLGILSCFLIQISKHSQIKMHLREKLNILYKLNEYFSRYIKYLYIKIKHLLYA